MIAIAGSALADITFCEDPKFRGRAFTSKRARVNFDRTGFNDKVLAVDVRGKRGEHGERWEVCKDPQFNGRCVVLRTGLRPSMGAMGLNDKLSSARPVGRNANDDDGRYASVPAYDPRSRPRPRPSLHQGKVTAMRAVVGPPEQRCWVEREQTSGERHSANIPAGIAVAVIGGILGHQVGGATGKDLATADGAVGGASIGAHIGRGGGSQTQKVQRCEKAPKEGRPDHWDVSYGYRGTPHCVQMQNPPSSAINVNAQGEPRV